jgi:hypothetical protein
LATVRGDGASHSTHDGEESGWDGGDVQAERGHEVLLDALEITSIPGVSTVRVGRVIAMTAG